MIEKEINLKNLIIVILLLSIIIFAFIQIKNTLARYETTTSTERNVDVAFWLVNTDFASERLLIDEIYPSNTAYEYTFTVSNFKDTKIAEVDLEYYLVLTATTNLPLNYEIQRGGTTIATFNHADTTTQNREKIITDDDGTQYVRLELGSVTEPFVINTINDDTRQKQEITDTFVVKVSFPKTYSVNEEYRDLMEDIKLDLYATQIIDE